MAYRFILSRTDPDFIRAILDLEVPEVYDKIVEVHKIVREPGLPANKNCGLFSSR